MKPLRVWYLFHGRIPSERAAALWAAKTAEGLAESGCEVFLVAAARGEQGNTYTAYNLKKVFSLVRLPVVNFFGVPMLRKAAFWVSSVSFSVSAFWYLRTHARRDDVLFSNEPLTLWLLSLFYSNSFFELHVLPTRKLFFFRSLLRRMAGIVAINEWLTATCAKTFDISTDKFCVARSGVEIDIFATRTSKEDARTALGLPREGKIALYAGHLYDWKGANVLAEAARHIPQVQVLFVGGTPADVSRFIKTYSATNNIHFVGQVPHTDIPIWQKAADVLVLPNTATKQISKYYTSPMKLFEYMASERPIVASRIPSIEEIVSDETATLVSADDAEALASGIRRVLADSDLAEQKAIRARRVADEYSWERRAEKILSFIFAHRT